MLQLVSLLFPLSLLALPLDTVNRGTVNLLSISLNRDYALLLYLHQWKSDYNKMAPLCHIHVKKSKESSSKSPPYTKKAMETFSSKIKPDTIIQPCSMNINIPSDFIHNLSPFFLFKEIFLNVIFANDKYLSTNYKSFMSAYKKCFA